GQLLQGAQHSWCQRGWWRDGPRVSSRLTLTAGSATRSCSFWRTLSGDTPGKMRQFTLARARCGSAFVAWPPSSIVATHVVRSVAFQLGSFADTSAIDWVSFGSFTSAFIAAAISELPRAAWIFAIPVK